MKNKFLSRLSAMGLATLMVVSASSVTASAASVPSKMYKLSYTEPTLTASEWFTGALMTDNADLKADLTKLGQNFKYNESFDAYFQTKSAAENAGQAIENAIISYDKGCYEIWKKSNPASATTPYDKYAMDVTDYSEDNVTEVNTSATYDGDKLTDFYIGAGEVVVAGESKPVYYFGTAPSNGFAGMITFPLSTPKFTGGVKTLYGDMIMAGQTSGGTGSGSGSYTDTPWLPASTYRVASDISYRGLATDGEYYYYTSLEALKSTGATDTYYKMESKYETGDKFFEPTTGFYSSALLSSKAYAVGASVTGNYSDELGSYKAADGKYYPSKYAAEDASFFKTGYFSSTEIRDYSEYRYFSTTTGYTYETEAEAKVAGGNVDLATYKAPKGNLKVTNPAMYQYWLLNGGVGGFGFGGSYGGFGSFFPSFGGTPTTTPSKDTSKITIPGTNYKGETSIAKAISNTKTGYIVTLSMNGQTSVDKEILAAAKKKGVNLKIKNSNGSTLVLKAADIASTTKDLNIGVDYECKNVSDALFNQAIIANPTAVTKSQVAVGTTGTVLNSTLTIKYNASREGKKAKFYVYDANYAGKGALILVDTAIVGENGYVTLDTKIGGEYIAILLG